MPPPMPASLNSIATISSAPVPIQMNWLDCSARGEYFEAFTAIGSLKTWTNFRTMLICLSPLLRLFWHNLVHWESRGICFGQSHDALSCPLRYCESSTDCITHPMLRP